MKIVLATGIYPPDIGGPATYVEKLAGELVRSGEEVGLGRHDRGRGWAIKHHNPTISFSETGLAVM